MWSQIAEWSIISKISGLGSIIVFIGTLVAFIRKNQLITTVTSTKIEQLFFTKEKKLYVRMFKFFMNFIFSVLCSCLIIIFFYEIKISSSIVYYILWGAITSYVVLIYVSYFKIDVFDRLLPKANKFIVVCIIFIFHIGCLFSFIPGFLVVTILESQLSINFNVIEQLLGAIIAIIITITFVNICFVALTIQTATQLLKKYNKYSEECFYIKAPDNIKWYIYYPIDNEYFLLGNELHIEEATIFCTKQRSEILSEKIYFLRLLRNGEESIEYHI
ncbi:hypothetical protein [Paenibacillus tundrae]|uniref:hypothetical protein n=1 Tax=Paenibacillus tundrae TaxID=528187 RepID=UPI0030CE89FD